MLACGVSDVLSDEGASREVLLEAVHVFFLELGDEREPALGEHDREAVSQRILALVLLHVLKITCNQAHVL